MFKDSLFRKIENKTNVDKNTILSIAEQLQNSDLKDENVLRELIEHLSNVTGKNVSEEKKQKIIDAVKNDKVPKNIDNVL